MSCRFPTLPNDVMCRKYPFSPCVDVKVGSALKSLCRRSLLGTCCFHLSIHDLNRSQIADLESLTHSYLKQWLGLPRGASWALVHDIHGLNIKSIDHLYTESRALTLSSVRFLGSGPDRGQSPVEWGDFPYVRPSVRPYVPPSGPSSQA